MTLNVCSVCYLESTLNVGICTLLGNADVVESSMSLCETLETCVLPVKGTLGLWASSFLSLRGRIRVSVI